MKSTKTTYLVRIALLMAITIVLAATPLGYIPAGVLSFTIMVLPVAIGGVLMGTPAGLILGLTFGVTSFIKAPTEALGQLILSYSGLFTAFVCIVPRVCVGLFAGLMHNVMKGRQKQPAWLYLLAGGGSSFVNTALFGRKRRTDYGYRQSAGTLCAARSIRIPPTTHKKRFKRLQN